MSARPSSTVVDARPDGVPQIASSAVVLGAATLGYNSGLSEGAVIRSTGDAVVIGTGSHVIENCVVAGYADHPVSIGRRTVFGHRCMVIGATVGDLCEIGNASVLMPGAGVGDRVFLGEGTVVPSGTTLPSDVVAWVGQLVSFGQPRTATLIVSRLYGEATCPSLHLLESSSNPTREAPPWASSMPIEESCRQSPRRPSSSQPPKSLVTSSSVNVHCRSWRQDHRRLAWPGADRQRRADPRKHRAALAT